MLVEVADLRRRKFADPGVARVDDQEGQNMMTRQAFRDPLDVLSERRRDMRAALLRQLAPLVPDRVRVDPVEIGDYPERVAGLLDRLPLVALLGQPDDERGHVVDVQLGDSPGAQAERS